MKCSLSLALFLAAAPAAFGDIITQTVPFDYSINDGATFPVLQGFDTLGGARELRGVTFEFHHNFTLELFVESTGPTPIAEGDFSLFISFISIFQLGQVGGKTDPPFFGPGAFSTDNATGALGAYDGVAGNDGPDSYRRTYNDSFTAVQEYGLAEPEVLAAVTDVGELTTVLGGFTELFFLWLNDPNWPIPKGGLPQYPTDAAVWVSGPVFRHFGDIEITYEYVNVPGPASASTLLGFSALGLLRRRRRSGSTKN